MKPLFPVLVSFALFAGCFSFRENLVRVTEVDGSNDHRVFRIGSLTKLMMEPALWQLEDSERINFDRPVTLYFKDKLPPEFEKITLRMLHDNLSGLPREFIDPWCLGDVCGAVNSGLFGTDVCADFDRRADFVRKLWDPRIRADVKRRMPQYSNMGYALMMMAISDELGESPEQLLQRYVVRPYGLEDTSFDARPDLRSRLTKSCAGHLPWLCPAGMEIPDHRTGDVKACFGGMLSSASDMLKVCYVMMPRLDRARGLLSERMLQDGRKVFYAAGMTYGGHAFVGFDIEEKHAAVVLENVTCWDTDEGFALLESLRLPPNP